MLICLHAEHSYQQSEPARLQLLLQAPMLSVENMEPAAAVATLRQALEGLNTLSGQRAALEEALKVCRTPESSHMASAAGRILWLAAPIRVAACCICKLGS
jgi:hypothetical protein